MKVVVTEMPKEPKECLFSELDVRCGLYICTLREYIPKADVRDNGYKPKCLCKHCETCNCLEVLK